MNKKSAKYLQLHEALHGKYSRTMAVAVQKAMRDDVLNYWKGNLTPGNYSAVLAGLKLPETEKILLKHETRIGSQTGYFVLTDIQGQIKRINPFFDQVWLNFILEQYGPDLKNRIVTITKTLIDDLVKQTAYYIENGVVDLAKQIDGYVNKPNFYLWQALRIAQTETTIAMNTATYQAGLASGLTLTKEWLTANDDIVRHSHEEINGEKKPMIEPFSNGLMYPGDPTGKASEVINCRCTILQRPLRDANGEIIYTGESAAILGPSGTNSTPTIQPGPVAVNVQGFEHVDWDVEKFSKEEVDKLGLRGFINVIFDKKNKSQGGSTGWVKIAGQYVTDNTALVYGKLNRDEMEKVIKHELRHIWQKQSGLFEFRNDGFYYWDGVKIFNIKSYQKIQDGIRRGGPQSENWYRKYLELPWEMDAHRAGDAFGGWAKYGYKYFDGRESVLTDNLPAPKWSGKIDPADFTELDNEIFAADELEKQKNN